jgi:hypothetical protein
MNRLDPSDPTHLKTRSILRTFGPVIFGVGLLCAIISAVNLFTADGEPKLFWLGFIGLPLMFVGGVMSMFGWQAALLKYQAREAGPVAGQSFNYLAGETREGIRDVVAAVGEGLRGQARISCPKCDAPNDADAKFCKSCGAQMK